MDERAKEKERGSGSRGRDRRSLKYVNSYKDRHGKQRYYYRRGGKQVPLDGEFGTQEWVNSYAAAHNAFEAGGDLSTKPGTFRAAMNAYLASRRYQKLKPLTQYNYKRHLEAIAEKIGHLPIKAITQGAVIKIRDRIADKQSPRIAIEIVSVISQVMKQAIEDDLITDNPALRVDKPHDYKAKPHRPWTQDELEAFLSRAKPLWRRAVMVLLCTGLRRDDAINLERRHIIDGKIVLIDEDATRKTSAEVVIPMHPNLIEELSRPLKVEHMKFLIPNVKGKKSRGDVLTKSVQAEFVRLGIGDVAPPLHGLRKNAVMYLLEIGCTYEEINSFTGQSMQMIKHYGKAYNRKALADKVQRKMMESAR